MPSYSTFSEAMKSNKATHRRLTASYPLFTLAVVSKEPYQPKEVVKCITHK